MKTVDNETFNVGQFSSSIDAALMPLEVSNACKAVVIDSIACAIAAIELAPGVNAAIHAMTQEQQVGTCDVIGTSLTMSAATAAFLNGALIHALNFDAADNRTGHQGIVGLAAPLAAAQLIGASGADLLAGCVVACELGARMTMAMSAAKAVSAADPFLRGQLLSYIPAAAGAARVLGLSTDQIISAMGLALMQTAGSRQVLFVGDPPAKAIYGGFPNQAGLQSAVLAQSGVEAEIPAFGPPGGFFSMYAPGAPEHVRIDQGLGTAYSLLLSQIKRYPVSSRIEPFIDACLRLSKQIKSLDSVRSVTIKLTDDFRPWCEPGEERICPQTATAASNSLPYAVARALMFGSFALEDLSSRAISDQRTERLARKIIFLFESSPLSIEVEHSDGCIHTMSVDQDCQPNEDKLAIAITKLKHVISWTEFGSRQKRLEDRLLALETCEDVRRLFD